MGSPTVAEHAVEGVCEAVGVVPSDAQRGLDLEHVLELSGRLDDDSELEHALAQRGGFLGGGLLGDAVADQLDAEVQSGAVDSADSGWARISVSRLARR